MKDFMEKEDVIINIKKEEIGKIINQFFINWKEIDMRGNQNLQCTKTYRPTPPLLERTLLHLLYSMKLVVFFVLDNCQTMLKEQ